MLCILMNDGAEVARDQEAGVYLGGMPLPPSLHKPKLIMPYGAPQALAKRMTALLSDAINAKQRSKFLVLREGESVDSVAGKVEQGNCFQSLLVPHSVHPPLVRGPLNTQRPALRLTLIGSQPGWSDALTRPLERMTWTPWLSAPK